MQRNMPTDRRTKITCGNKDCGNTIMWLEAGELVVKAPPGQAAPINRVRVQCDLCGHLNRIPVRKAS